MRVCMRVTAGADLLSEAPGAVGREINVQWMDAIALNMWLRQRDGEAVDSGVAST